MCARTWLFVVINRQIDAFVRGELPARRVTDLVEQPHTTRRMLGGARVLPAPVCATSEGFRPLPTHCFPRYDVPDLRELR